jgi:hypothetical protein
VGGNVVGKSCTWNVGDMVDIVNYTKDVKKKDDETSFKAKRVQSAGNIKSEPQQSFTGTVYEGEAVGTILGAKLVSKECTLSHGHLLYR